MEAALKNESGIEPFHFGKKEKESSKIFKAFFKSVADTKQNPHHQEKKLSGFNIEILFNLYLSTIIIPYYFLLLF